MVMWDTAAILLICLKVIELYNIFGMNFQYSDSWERKFKCTQLK